VTSLVGDPEHNRLIDTGLRHRLPQSRDRAVTTARQLGRAAIEGPPGDLVGPGVAVDIDDHQSAS